MSSNPTSLPAQTGDQNPPEFSINDFMRDAAEAPPATPEPKPEPEPEPKPTPIVEPISDEHPITITDQAKPSRSFEGLDPKIAPLFKQMSNEAYNTLYPAFLEYNKLKQSHQELQQKLEQLQDSTWWQQEGAWMLHPEYKTLSAISQNLDYEHRFWQEQLANIEGGRPWKKLYKDPKTGEYSEGDPEEPSPEGKALVISQMNKALFYSQEVGKRLGDLTNSFQTKFSSFQENLKALDKEFFGTLDMQKWGPRVNEWLSRFPPLVRERTEFQMLAKAATVIEGLVAALQRVNGQQKLQSHVNAASINAGPIKSSTPVPPSQDGDSLWKAFQAMSGSSL